MPISISSLSEIVVFVLAALVLRPQRSHHLLLQMRVRVPETCGKCASNLRPVARLRHAAVDPHAVRPAHYQPHGNRLSRKIYSINSIKILEINLKID